MTIHQKAVETLRAAIMRLEQVSAMRPSYVGMRDDVETLANAAQAPAPSQAVEWVSTTTPPYAHESRAYLVMTAEGEMLGLNWYHDVWLNPSIRGHAPRVTHWLRGVLPPKEQS